MWNLTIVFHVCISLYPLALSKMQYISEREIEIRGVHMAHLHLVTLVNISYITIDYVAEILPARRTIFYPFFSSFYYTSFWWKVIWLKLIFTAQIWDYVMPYWLESIRMEVPEDELMELKVLLRWKNPATFQSIFKWALTFSMHSFSLSSVKKIWWKNNFKRQI